MNGPVSIPPPAPLRFWHGLQGVAFSLLLAILFWGGLYALGAAGFVELADWRGLSLQVLVLAVIFAGSAVFIASGRTTSVRASFALRAPSVGFTLVAAVGVIPAGVLGDEVVRLLHLLRPTIFSTQAMGELGEVFTQAPFAGFVVLTAAISILPALGEEVLFRGLVLRSFLTDMPPHFAVLYSSILFGFVHLDWLQGTAAGLLGVYLGFAAWAGGSIWPAVLCHGINNLVWCLLARYLPGATKEVFTTGHGTGTLLLCAVLTLLAIAGLWYLRSNDDEDRSTDRGVVP